MGRACAYGRVALGDVARRSGFGIAFLQQLCRHPSFTRNAAQVDAATAYARRRKAAVALRRSRGVGRRRRHLTAKSLSALARQCRIPRRPADHAAQAAGAWRRAFAAGRRLAGDAGRPAPEVDPRHRPVDAAAVSWRPHHEGTRGATVFRRGSSRVRSLHESSTATVSDRPFTDIDILVDPANLARRQPGHRGVRLRAQQQRRPVPRPAGVQMAREGEFQPAGRTAWRSGA